jgi:hypothetical protein
MAFADLYRGYMAECADAIDEFMGEKVIVIPTQGIPNFPKEPIAGQEIETIAVFTWVSETGFNNADAKRISFSREVDLAPLLTTRKPRFSFKANYLPFPILSGYRIQRCVDASLWDVTSAKPDGVSRIEVAVVQLGRSTQ